MRPGIVGAAAAGEVIVPGDTGWQLPTIAVNHTGSGDTNWSNIDAVKNTSTSEATCSIKSDYSGTTSARFIRAQGFDFSAVPDGAVISELHCQAYHYKNSGNTGVTAFYICKDSAVDGNASAGIVWPTSLSLVTKTTDASSNSMWGTTGITPAKVKESDFGCFFGGTGTSGSYQYPTLRTRYIQMKVVWVAP